MIEIGLMIAAYLILRAVCSVGGDEAPTHDDPQMAKGHGVPRKGWWS